MIRNHSSLSALLMAAAIAGGFAGSAQAQSADDLQKAVTELGKLNGIALACKQGALSARLREAVIDLAPKERTIGEYFEQATNETFLSFGQNDEKCPDGKTLADQAAAAREALRQAVGAKP